MRTKMVIGNWKMHGSIDEIVALLENLQASLPKTFAPTCVILPPVLYLPLVASLLTNSAIKWGVQNIYPEDAGAFTGEISASMLKDYGCHYVLVGHSERRRLFHEDEKFVAKKFHHVKDHGMIPVLCVGETLSERESGLTEQVLTQQLLAVTELAGNHCFKDNNCFKNCIIAYEPVWAIGTGRTASPTQAQAAIGLIRRLVATFDEHAATQLSILYGGSVNGANASSLFAMQDIDGGLVGAASLHAQQFVEIVKCIN